MIRRRRKCVLLSQSPILLCRIVFFLTWFLTNVSFHSFKMSVCIRVVVHVCGWHIFICCCCNPKVCVYRFYWTIFFFEVNTNDPTISAEMNLSMRMSCGRHTIGPIKRPMYLTWNSKPLNPYKFIISGWNLTQNFSITLFEYFIALDLN